MSSPESIHGAKARTTSTRKKIFVDTIYFYDLII